MPEQSAKEYAESAGVHEALNAGLWKIISSRDAAISAEAREKAIEECMTVLDEWSLSTDYPKLADDILALRANTANQEGSEDGV